MSSHSELAAVDDEAAKPDASRHEAKRKRKSSQQKPQGGGVKESEITFPVPPTMSLELNVLLIVLVGLSFGTRFWRLTSVHYVVFDELHLGQFTNFLVNSKYFFDANPPLGKLLYAATAYVSGYDGQFSFDDIGQDFGSHVVDIGVLRAVAAFLGSLVVPMVYGITFDLSKSDWAAAMAAFLVTFDNMFVVTSKFALFDAPLVFFTAASIFSFLKFHKHADSPFTWSWWFWLASLGFSLMGVASVKYVGLLTVISTGILVGRDFWKILGDRAVSLRDVSLHALARGLLLFLVPVLLYLLQFAVLFAVLVKAGPNDDMMSSAFQASLQGGLAKITHGQAQEIAYGSQVTLRNTFERQCWLHSHSATYPVKYPDGRGSSAQQQVTCYGFKDENNWWIIKDPNRDKLQVDFPPRPVLNGDIVQIIHGSSGRALNSHDVAAPLNPANQEVSCYIDYNISMPAQNLWKVEIVNPGEGNSWKTIQSQVRFVHVNTSQAIKISGQTLPDWGFAQLEVCTDRLVNQQSTIWNVEEHQQNISYPEGYDPEEQKPIPVPEEGEQKVIPMPFFRKYVELQLKMVQSTKDTMNEHRYSSRPSLWPFMRMGVAYWMAKEDNTQIFCLGNPFVWWVSLLSLPAYFGLLAFYLLRRRRGLRDLTEDSWNQFIFVGEVLVLGYLLHFVPYFFTERTVFIYYYLPALLFNIILLPVMIEHVHTNVLPDSWPRVVLCAGCVFVCILVLWAFKHFSPLTYANVALSSAELQNLKWLKTWDYLQHS